MVAGDPVTGKRHWRAERCSRAAQQTERLTVDEERGALYTASEGTHCLHALSLGDGETRWTTRLPEGHCFAAHNRFAQTDQLLYAAVERTRPYRQSALLVLDKANGARVRSAAVTASAQDLQLGGGHLLVLESLTDLRPGYGSTVLVARDPTTLVTRWRAVISGCGTAHRGHIVTLGDSAWTGSTTGVGFITCIDLTSGKQRWRADGMRGGGMTLTDDDRPLLISQQQTHIIALDAQSGESVWRVDLGCAEAGSLCYASGIVYHSRGSWLYALDAATGRPLAVTESESGSGLSVWSNGEQVCWSTEKGVQIYQPAPHD